MTGNAVLEFEFFSLDDWSRLYAIENVYTFLITIEPQPVLITEQASLAYQCNRSIIA